MMVVHTFLLHQQNQDWVTAWAPRAFLKTISTLQSIISTSETQPVG